MHALLVLPWELGADSDIEDAPQRRPQVADASRVLVHVRRVEHTDVGLRPGPCLACKTKVDGLVSRSAPLRRDERVRRRPPACVGLELPEERRPKGGREGVGWTT